jgi:hypothetical protein
MSRLRRDDLGVGSEAHEYYAESVSLQAPGPVEWSKGVPFLRVAVRLWTAVSPSDGDPIWVMFTTRDPARGTYDGSGGNCRDGSGERMTRRGEGEKGEVPPSCVDMAVAGGQSHEGKNKRATARTEATNSAHPSRWKRNPRDLGRNPMVPPAGPATPG